jgi:hypothetical protein
MCLSDTNTSAPTLAGVPMMNGSNVLEGYVPDVDATPS